MNQYDKVACSEQCTDFYTRSMEARLARAQREPFEAAYAQDALSNMHEAERRRGARRWFQDQLGARVGITFNRRKVLVNWMNELCADFNFSSHTFELAVQCIIMDDYVYDKRAQIALSRYQCLGTTCVRLAAKMQELDNGSNPSMHDYANMTKFTSSCSQICAVEFALVKSTAPTSLMAPTPHSFLNYYRGLASCRAWDQSRERRTTGDSLSSYYCELSSLVPDMLAADNAVDSTGFLPSTIAAASLLINRATLGMPPWCFDLQRISGIDALNYGTINECAEKLVDFQNAMLDSTTMRADPLHNCIFLKFKEVSALRPPSMPTQALSNLNCSEETLIGKYMEITL
jgi:hypothetical protein